MVIISSVPIFRIFTVVCKIDEGCSWPIFYLHLAFCMCNTVYMLQFLPRLLNLYIHMGRVVEMLVPLFLGVQMCLLVVH